MVASAKPEDSGAPKAEVKTSTASRIRPLDSEDGRGRKVVVIPIEGTIDLGLAPFVKRLYQDPNVVAFILDVDTFGGRVDAAVKIRDVLLESRVPTVAFVNHRAISAGALISLAADVIVFAPGGTLGAATPIQLQGGEAKPVEEKMVSYMRSEMRATAEAKGRRGDIAEAMVDADVEIPGISPKGKLLTATTELARRIGLSDAEADTLPDVLAMLSLSRAEVVRAEPNWAEKVARFLTDPTVSGLLMSLGFLALMIELYTPGFGAVGAIGLMLLGLFFGGHMIVELAGWEELLLFSLGLVGIVLEIFVFPGTGVAGILGAAMVLASLVLAMIGLPLSISWSIGAISSATGLVLTALGVSVGALLLLANRLPKTRAGRWMVLKEKIGPDLETSPKSRVEVGQTGTALTDLRLSGKAKIGESVLDVVSQHEYIDKGAPVRVSEIDGLKIVVVKGQQGA
ncbi:MAG: nodulation protein NfeD [Deltaproteobacteria bacterium]|nr:nodulation protein NfeD [Deltaproteobacteria bacterium]